MNNIRTIALIVLLAFIAMTAAAQNLRVLFIGNSYTHGNNMPLLVQSLASAGGDTLTFEMLAYNSYTLNQHIHEAATKQTIEGGEWDFVVLQEQSQLPASPMKDVKKKFFPAVHQLTDWIKTAGAQAVLYMTWGRRDGDQARSKKYPPVSTYEGMDDLLAARYEQAAQQTNSWLAPVGKAWRYVRTNHPEIELYYYDGSHPNQEGSFLTACTLYTILYNKRPDELDYHFYFAPDLAHQLKTAAGLFLNYNRP
jgi:hypothetical protein